MNTKLQGIITLKSSLSHIGESFGNQSLLRREKVIDDALKVNEVVVYSGNALRGALREVVAMLGVFLAV